MHSIHLADGKLVQLSGQLGAAELPALRLALLMPMHDDCRDVVIDAGEVEAIDDAAVALLLAAREWAWSTGVRILLSRSTTEFDQALADLGLPDLLPRLSAPRAEPTHVELPHVALPRPRVSVD